MSSSDVNIAKPSIVAEQVEDYELMKFVMQNDTISLVHRSVDINVDRYKLIDLLESYNFRVVNTSKSTFFAVGDAQFVTVDIRNWSTTVNIVATSERSVKFVDMLVNTFDHNPCYVKYVYDPQYMEYTTLPINNAKQPLQEMYPWMDEPLTSFFDRFVASDSNILILTGIPGSGKTTLVRGLLTHTKQSAILAYNPKIIENDSFFVQWLESTDMFMILEDADNLITPRKDGNDVMSKFLNIGDGLMSFKNKKIIFSTNLPSVASIDPALTRAGRCFDIVQFDYLNREQAQRLADVVQLPLADGTQFTVSDVFSASRNEVKFAKDAKLNRGFGFV